MRNIIRARFDSAQTTPENRRHWAASDHLSPDAALIPAVRRTLRSRARYEVANNSYAKGMQLTLTNDTVGTGPRLQMLIEDEKLKAAIEKRFGEWVRAIGLAEKLRIMRGARVDTGEVFGVQVTNELLPTAVKLDMRVVEADQFSDPFVDLQMIEQSGNLFDGVTYDDDGNPVSYRMLKQHPGDIYYSPNPMAFDTIPADVVMHYFRPDRPGQKRGIPELTPALPLFAMLRRYTLAVIAAAETVADFAAVLYSDAPPDAEVQDVEPMDVVSLERRMATVLPQGWKLGQIQAEQPTTTYQMFKDAILNEAARCLNMPFNVAACNSSGYNYSSGQLDHMIYFRSIRIEQSVIEQTILEPLFNAWLDEALLIPGYLPVSGPVEDISHQWGWDGRDHADPTKMANAQQTRLQNNTTTLAREYSAQGLDWEKELRQRGKEKKLMDELGLSPTPAAAPAPAPASAGQSPAQDPNADENADEEANALEN